ncbi:MAG: HD domain-containing protein [Aristaeellaceae bacterium]
MNRLDQLTLRTMAFFAGDARRIQHLTKVHAYAALIGRMEGLDEATQAILEAAAVVHDVGIKPAEAQYGSCGGKLQEALGPAEARTLLTGAGYSPEETERVAWLVGHHHTYDPIEGIDHQILVEADFLVNLHEDGCSTEAIHHTRDRIFRTDAGKHLLEAMF